MPELVVKHIVDEGPPATREMCKKKTINYLIQLQRHRKLLIIWQRGLYVGNL